MSMSSPAARLHTASGADAPAGARDLFLDAIRAVAIVRVVAWHTFGWAPLTWIVSAVPAMIFVSGHLLAQSYERRRALTVLTDRLRRLLVPFWAFGAVAWAIMIGADWIRHEPETALPVRNLALWILPINDPQGSVWEAGWLSQPLWYLRVLLLLLVASPLLVRLARRPALAALGLMSVTVALELGQRSAQWFPRWAPDLVWRSGDFTLYATFFVLGMAHHKGTLRFSRPSDWATAAVVSALCAASFAVALEPQDWVANNSHIVHFCVGAAWLSVAFALRAPLTRIVSQGLPQRAIRAIGRRSLTIYLWHSACAITVWHILDEFAPLPRGSHSIALGIGTAVLTAAAVMIFGAIEDVAAGRRAGAPMPAAAGTHGARATHAATGRWALRVIGIAMITLAAALTLPHQPRAATESAQPFTSFGDEEQPVAASSSTRRGAAAPRVPSQAPRRPDFQRSSTPRPPAAGPATTRPAAASSPATGPRAIEPWTPEANPPPAELAELLGDAVNRWASGWGIDGIRVAVARPDSFAWKTAVGTNWDGSPLDAHDSFDIESITKTFTATLVWQLAYESKVELDATLPALAGIDEFPSGTYTVRQLLEHRSGIPDYHDTYDYAPDSNVPIDRAIASALLSPGLSAPGERQSYSSTNYLVLGRFLEQHTGRSLQTLLSERIFEPNGIGARFTHGPSTIEAPGGGAAGLLTNLDGLVVWADVLLRRHLPLGEDAFAQMATLTQTTSLGPGLYGYCPCSYDERDRPVWQGIGHSGGTTALQYLRDYDLVIAYQVPTGVWSTNYEPLEFLVERLVDIVSRYPI